MFVLLLLIILAVLLAAWFLTFRMHRQRLYELADKLPGPPELPFIGHLHRFMGDREVITDPVDIEYVLKTCLEKDEITRFIRKTLGNGIIFAPASLWPRRRKNMAPGLSTKSVDNFFEHFRDKSNSLSKQLQSQVGVGEFDLWLIINSYTMASAYESISGIGTTEQIKDHEKAIRTLSQLQHLISERFFRPWLHPDWLYRMSSSGRVYQKSMKFANSFIDDMIKRTKTNIKTEELRESKAGEEQVNKPREWTSLLRFMIKQASKMKAYSNLELREEVMSILTAGTDTMAVSMCFTMVLLARHEDIQDRVHQQLVDVFGKSDRPLEKEDLSKLCYLEQVIKESLRLYPPVPLISRQADKEVTLPSGAVLPAGCGIPINIWGVHRNPAYWGADAELFRPERFSPERYNPQDAYVYMPFGAGSRNCLGYQYAMTFIKISLATVLRKYRLRVTREKSTFTNIRVKYEIMMKSVDGFKIILELRD